MLYYLVTKVKYSFDMTFMCIYKRMFSLYLLNIFIYDISHL